MKLCMIGSRGHSHYVFESIADVPGIELAAVSSGSLTDSPEPLLDMAGKAGFSPAVEADWRAMLDRHRPDLVSVDGPFDRHAEMTVEALRRNISVFCEKPVALTFEELSEVERTLADSRAHLMAMVGLRYLAEFQYALELVRAGRVGTVKLVSARKSYRLGARPDYYRSRRTFGGLIPWVGSHALDWIMAYSGSRFAQIYATHTAADNFGYGEMEIAAQMSGRMRNGVQFSATCDYLRPAAAPTHGDDRVRIAGTAGVLEVSGGKVELIDGDGARILPVPPPARKLFADFANSLAGTHPCMVGDADTIELARACLYARESADTGRIMDLTGKGS